MPKDESDPEDPVEFVGVGVPGTEKSDEEMAAAVVEEYLLFGYDRNRLMGLFTDPNYRATHRIYAERGEPFVRGVIDRVLAEWGPVDRVLASRRVVEAPEPDGPGAWEV